MRIIFKNQLFDDPAFIIRCFKLSEVENCFKQMEAALAKGCYLAGFLSYEAGYAFEPCFHNNKAYDFPLVCFGVYRYHGPHPKDKVDSPRRQPRAQRERGENYFSALKRIKRQLAAGNSYQVNYTFKLKFDFKGDPFSLYNELIQRQPTPYSAFIETEDFSVLSLSPELFFHKQGEKIKVKPMKGTLGLGKGNRQRLRRDPKNRAENLMIVDLLRNDLGRIAKTGSVKTTRLFEIEKHPTLYQMTSTVEAEVPENIDLYHLFKNIFPSGSVTGAPKIRTMQIIRELEKEERKIYTGAIGYITPQKDLLFNVAIRTLLIKGNHGELGIGSGITYASDPQQEWEECRLKARFLTG